MASLDAKWTYFDQQNVGGWHERGQILREQKLWAIAKDGSGCCEIWVDGQMVVEVDSYATAKRRIFKIVADRFTVCRQ